MTPTLRNILSAGAYFALSTIFTWWFVVVSPLYISQDQMLLSTGIAGAKWSLQILLAFLFLREKAWVFVKNIGFVCLVGSCILLPYVLFSLLNITNDPSFFLGSLIVSVLTMIVLYYRAVRRTQLPVKWFLIWLLCLATAISLQLTVVFHYL